MTAHERTGVTPSRELAIPDDGERRLHADRYPRSCRLDAGCRRCAAPARGDGYCSDVCERVIEELLRELRADVEHARSKWQLCEQQAARPTLGVSPGFARRTAGRWRVCVETLEAEIASLLTPPTRGTTA